MAKTWTKLAAMLSVARYRHSTVHDTDNDRILVFGGVNQSNTTLQDLQQYPFNVAAWSQLNPANPPSVRGQCMAFWDRINHKMVLGFGWDQHGNPNPVYNDLYTYPDGNGDFHVELADGAPGSPSKRHSVAWGVHPSGSYVLVFGGWNGFYPCGGWWKLTIGVGSYTWQQLTPTGDTPADRGYAAMVWDARIQKFILAQGIGGFNWSIRYDDAFSYDPVTNVCTNIGASWNTEPPPAGFSFAADSDTGRLFYLGSIDPVGNGTWVWELPAGGSVFSRQSTLPLQPGEGGFDWDPPPLARAYYGGPFYRPTDRSHYVVGGQRYLDLHNDTQLLTNTDPLPDGPQITNKTPAPGRTGVELGAGLGFDFTSGLGDDVSSVVVDVTVDGVTTRAWEDDAPQNGWTGSRSAITDGFHYSLTPSGFWPPDTSVLVHVEAADLFGHECEATWSFTTRVIPMEDDREYCLDLGNNKDLSLDGGGALVRDYSILSRARMRLMVRRGQYVYDRTLGSRLHELRTDKALRTRALAVCTEALQPLVDEGVITKIEVPEPQIDEATGTALIEPLIEGPDLEGRRSLGSYRIRP